MLTSLTQIFTTSAFSLQNLEGFPYQDWLAQQETYAVLESWYNAKILDVVLIDQKTERKVEKYPIKISPIRSTSQKHAALLMGVMSDLIVNGGLPVRIFPSVSGNQKEEYKVVEDFIEKTLVASGGGSIFSPNAIISQYLGGSFFALSFLPREGRILVSTPMPTEVYAITNGVDYWNIIEAWIVREVSEQAAKSYNPDVTQASDGKYYYIEHLTPSTIEVSINGLQCSETPLSSPNIFGFVPLVYIPHIRTSGFLGESFITETIKGVLREMNLRWADIGDATGEDSHDALIGRNIRGTPRVVDIDGRRIIDIGATSGFTAGEAQPEVYTIKMKSLSETMIKFAEDLYVVYRREANHPAVADGEDEGSQRSSLTLVTRMWPMVAEVLIERTHWTTGLLRLADMILKIALAKNLAPGLTAEKIAVKLGVQWRPMLPRDREALVNEAALRAKNNLASHVHLMETLGDIDNCQDEWETVLDELKELQPLVATNPFGAPGSDGTEGVYGSQGNVRGSQKS